MTDETTAAEELYFVPPSPFDEALVKVPGLTWLPWVGANYPNLPAGRKVLIVGESHYTSDQNLDLAKALIHQRTQDRGYTRAVVLQSLVLGEWSTRTLSTLHKLLFSPQDRAAFWGDLCYYNLVQRMMASEDGRLGRPAWEDFWKGWEVFLSVVDVLQPDHVLFIGVESANLFRNAMSHFQRDYSDAQRSELVGSAYAREGSISLGDRIVPLHFIKHCGKHFPMEKWSDYLQRTAGGLMPSIAASAGHAC